MRFLLTHKIDEQKAAANPPSQETMAEMGKLIEELTNSGVLIATGGLLPSAKGTRLRFAEGKRTVTDGPFTESKEMIAGFAVIDARSKEEVIELATRFAGIGGDVVEIEIRQMWEDESPSSALKDTEQRLLSHVVANG